MRNLKKILALVLALVMTMSVMATAAFTDAAEIDGAYDEAAEVLAGLKVFVGRTDGSFDPKASITRAEVAAIIYRIATGDVKDASVKLYTEGADFTDTKGHWAEGYIGYCNNAGFIAGYGNGKFGPNDKVTGMQAAAMILRAVGYDAQDEFTGANWDKYVAKYAQENGLFKNLKADVNLNKPVSREVVAEILFQAIQAPMVQWTPAFEYQPTLVLGKDVSLGWKTFQLTKTARGTIDNWGRPGYDWYRDLDKNGVMATTEKLVTIKEDALAKYTTAVAECQIAADAFKGAVSTSVNTLWVNGDLLENQSYAVQAADTITKLGDQGRLTEVYKDRIVMIDTMLAKVTAVSAAKYDAAGHQYLPASITLDIYAANDTATAVTLTSKTDYTYTKGQYVLVNAETVATNDLFGGHGAVATADATKYVTILGVAETVVGPQTLLYYRAGQHVVNGTVYVDANCFHLDQADLTGNVNYTWYLDQYGNLIGATEIATQYDYAVIKNIQWITQVGAVGYAQATLTMADGTEKSVVVNKLYHDDVDMTVTTNGALTGVATTADYAGNKVSIEYSYSPTSNFAQFFGKDLFRVQTLSNGTVNLVDVEHDAVTKGYVVESDTTITSGHPYFVGASGATIAVDDSTQYLFWNKALTGTAYYTYSAVTGYRNITSYNAEYVDYVLGADGRADLVYVVGTPANTNASGLFYLTDSQFTYMPVYDANGAIKYYEIPGVFNGETGSIKVQAALTTGEYFQADGVKASSTLTGLQLVEAMVNAVEALDGAAAFAVNTTNGFVTRVAAVGADRGQGFDKTTTNGDAYDSWNTGAYNNKAVERLETAGTLKAYFDGTNLTVLNGTTVVTSFNVADAKFFGETLNVGTYDVTNAYAGTTLIGQYSYVFHVVYTDLTLKATEVYVYQVIPGSNSGSIETPVDTVVYQVEIYESGSLINTIKAATWKNATDATNVAFSDLLAKMESTTPDANWTNFTGALNALKSLDASKINPINVDASTGVATFIYSVN